MKIIGISPKNKSNVYYQLEFITNIYNYNSHADAHNPNISKIFCSWKNINEFYIKRQDEENISEYFFLGNKNKWVIQRKRVRITEVLTNHKTLS